MNQRVIIIKVVKPHNLIAVIQEVASQTRTNKPRDTGNQNSQA